jgi:hypothetical protein
MSARTPRHRKRDSDARVTFSTTDPTTFKRAVDLSDDELAAIVAKELGPNPVRHLARCGTAMSAARLYARETTNQGGSNACLTGTTNSLRQLERQ